MNGRIYHGTILHTERVVGLGLPMGSARVHLLHWGVCYCTNVWVDPSTFLWRVWQLDRRNSGKGTGGCRWGLGNREISDGVARNLSGMFPHPRHVRSPFLSAPRHASVQGDENRVPADGPLICTASVSEPFVSVPPARTGTTRDQHYGSLTSLDRCGLCMPTCMGV